VGGWLVGGCTYDYNVSLSPNIWIMSFNLDLDLDLGLTIDVRGLKKKQAFNNSVWLSKIMFPVFPLAKVINSPQIETTGE